MKLQNLILGLALSAGIATAQAGTYSISQTFGTGAGLIPDGSFTGFSDSHTLSTGTDTIITGVTVTLNISGGYNGDLYGYLSYGGVLIPLINRVGVSSSNPSGSGDSGFSVTLSSSGTYNIHDYAANSPTINGSGQVTGTYAPDGRLISPTSTAGSFDAAGTVGFGSLNGLNPNGTWTIAFFDVSGGGGTSKLDSYSIDITAVPEPVNVALGGFASLFILGAAFRSQAVRSQMNSLIRFSRNS